MADQGRADTFRQEFDKQARAFFEGDTDCALTPVWAAAGECLVAAEGNLQFQNSGSVITLSYKEDDFVLGSLGFDSHRGLAVGFWEAGEREGEWGLVGYDVPVEDYPPVRIAFAPDAWARPDTAEGVCQGVVLRMLERLRNARPENDGLDNDGRRLDLLRLMFKASDWPFHYDQVIAKAVR